MEEHPPPTQSDPPGAAAYPVGDRVEADADLTWLNGHSVVGGSPLRRATMSQHGAMRLRRLLAGDPVTAHEAEFVWRLLDAGIVHPRPVERTPGAGSEQVTIVVPFHGPREQLRALLEVLPQDRPIVVVDDGSPAAAKDAVDGDSRVVRHRQNRGPAAARNTGWRHARTEFVAFFDADVTPDLHVLDRLLDHMRDARLALVAPRVTCLPDDRILARFEQTDGPLDMGDRAAIVQPRGRVPYVPSAAWLVRREALIDVSGFDESLRLGEDVDLVWRFNARGWRVRYDPSARVAHRARATLAAGLHQRHDYGRSAARLWQRHPGRLRHLEVSDDVLLSWLAGATMGLPAALGCVGATVGAGLRRSDRLPPSHLVKHAMRSHGFVARYLRRVALPAVLAAAPASRPARRLLLAMTLPYLADHRSRRSSLDPLRYTAMRIADDIAYATGAWRGAAEVGRARFLLPHRVSMASGTRPDGAPRAGPVP